MKLQKGRDYKFMTYKKHAIWFRITDDGVCYGYAKKRNGTDEWFDSYEACKDDIDKFEEEKNQK